MIRKNVLFAISFVFLMLCSLFAGEKVIDVNMKSPVTLPFSGAEVKQLSGIKVELKGGSFTAPDQVCCLIFDNGKDKAIVRVWENKDHRYFVSTTGDDKNDGSEKKPWKTIEYALVTVPKKDADGDLYAAGGDYVVTKRAAFEGKVSMYGGFDEKSGWRRDPAITESVLLPHGFRDKWVDDMSPRFKDLRRAEHRIQETRIRRDKFTKDKDLNCTLRIAGSGTDSSPDTYIDGLTIFGAPNTGTKEPFELKTPETKGNRTIRNNIFVMGYNNGHSYMPGGHGTGRWENNIMWGGVVSRESNCRPQTIYRSGAHMVRNLQICPMGGGYTRVFICWGEGGLVEESQIHGGMSFERADTRALQAQNDAVFGENPYRFERNLFDVDKIAQTCCLSGLSMKDNVFHLREFGFGNLFAWKSLEITGNTFMVSGKASKDNIFPTAGKMVQKLGGIFGPDSKGKGKPGPGGHVSSEQPVYKEPAGNGTGKPTIANNKIEADSQAKRYLANFVDLDVLDKELKAKGEDACLPPKLPPTDLKAVAAGSGAVRLTWQASKDPEVIGYVVRWGDKTDSYANHQIVKGATGAEVKGLKSGKNYFTVAAFKPAVIECFTLSNEAVAEVK
jgi:hypothetical protein